MRLRDPAVWVVFPAIYAGFATLRGTLTGFRPYPFLDAGRLGPVFVAANIALLMLAFLLLGRLVLWLARISR